MRRLFISMLVCALATVLASSADAGGTVYGDGVTIEQAVTVETLTANPDDYVGKRVRVDGVITAVCKKRGCWMQLTDADTGKGIRVKVEDGVIVFPYTAMGHGASAEGVFEVIKLTPEQIAARKAHMAQEAAEKAQATSGESCDRTAGAAEREGTGCAPEIVGDTVFLLRGTGAVIHE